MGRRFPARAKPFGGRSGDTLSASGHIPVHNTVQTPKQTRTAPPPQPQPGAATCPARNQARPRFAATHPGPGSFSGRLGWCGKGRPSHESVVHSPTPPNLSRPNSRPQFPERRSQSRAFLISPAVASKNPAAAPNRSEQQASPRPQPASYRPPVRAAAAPPPVQPQYRPPPPPGPSTARALGPNRSIDPPVEQPASPG